MPSPQDVAERIKTVAKGRKVSVAKLLKECELNKDLISTKQLRVLPIISTCPLTTFSEERISRKLIGEMGKQELNLR